MWANVYIIFKKHSIIINITFTEFIVNLPVGKKIINIPKSTWGMRDMISAEGNENWHTCRGAYRNENWYNSRENDISVGEIRTE